MYWTSFFFKVINIVFGPFTLFRCRLREVKVSLVETLAINVTFIYYNPHLSKTHI